DGLKSVTFYSGFDGEAQRDLLEIDATGPPRGLLALCGGQPFKLSDLPPLPPDATSFWALNFDVGALHDVGVQLAENVSRFAGKEGRDEVRAALRKVDDLLGINLRDDLLGSLGKRIVLYSTPAEGALVLNHTLLFQVKDAKKLEESLELALRGVMTLAGN